MSDENHYKHVYVKVGLIVPDNELAIEYATDYIGEIVSEEHWQLTDSVYNQLEVRDAIDTTFLDVPAFVYDFLEDQTAP